MLWKTSSKLSLKYISKMKKNRKEKIKMNKKEAYKIVFEDLKKHPLFIGKYDAKNGNPHFMNGIVTVMEFITYNISEETYFDFCCTWTSNIIKSEEKYEED